MVMLLRLSIARRVFCILSVFYSPLMSAKLSIAQSLSYTPCTSIYSSPVRGSDKPFSRNFSDFLSTISARFDGVILAEIGEQRIPMY